MYKEKRIADELFSVAATVSCAKGTECTKPHINKEATVRV